MVFPNRTDAGLVAAQYRGDPEDVVVIPHIKDLRSFWDFNAETCRFIEEHPEIMAADVVQLLPASADRLWHKRVDVVISIFGALKRLGLSVCLVVANQWATGRGRKEELKTYQGLARDEGLEWGEEVVFTSEFGEKYEKGISKTMIRELFLCSNLFVFPTHHESFGPGGARGLPVRSDAGAEPEPGPADRPGGRQGLVFRFWELVFADVRAGVRGGHGPENRGQDVPGKIA